jgi:MoaA/NifB/PqqE/SkfB family radical SAM enzyme
MTIAEHSEQGRVHLPVTHRVSTEPSPGPELRFLGLDVLWLQVTGTVCNIACRHCFISCGPKNDSHPFMTREHVLGLLDEAEGLGVKEYYFTGGEPFLHPDILELCEATLAQGPLSILTNALKIDGALAGALGRLAAQSEYSLDLRVSLDGTTPEENDPVRGRGTFAGILEGARRLQEACINPVFTVTTVHAAYEGEQGRARFMDRLRELGFARPRVKFIPPFRIGREERRAGGYPEGYILSEGDLMQDEEHMLMCGSGRMVTAKGVYPCPILIEQEGARMGGELQDGLRPIQLNHPACVTCHVEGFSCKT